MAAKPKFDPRRLMEKAIAVMKQSINEPRADKKASPPAGDRNPKLQFAFGGTKLVEGRGFGMKSFGEAAAKYGLPVPRYAFDGLYLNLTIYRHAQAAVEALGTSILNKLSKSERAGWEWLATKGSTKSSEYAAGMKVDERTARRHLNQFLKLGLARKSGAGPSTDYTIKQ